jgi:hypothetical protein
MCLETLFVLSRCEAYKGNLFRTSRDASRKTKKIVSASYKAAPPLFTFLRWGIFDLRPHYSAKTIKLEH